MIALASKICPFTIWSATLHIFGDHHMTFRQIQISTYLVHFISFAIFHISTFIYINKCCGHLLPIILEIYKYFLTGKCDFCGIWDPGQLLKQYVPTFKNIKHFFQVGQEGGILYRFSSNSSLWYISSQESHNRIADRFNVAEASIVRCRDRLFQVFLNYSKKVYYMAPRSSKRKCHWWFCKKS